ncbi:hypothetical protein SDJN03_09941, partial [Cucurbita argyrosperma subsp. sororia]
MVVMYTPLHDCNPPPRGYTYKLHVGILSMRRYMYIACTTCRLYMYTAGLQSVVEGCIDTLQGCNLSLKVVQVHCRVAICRRTLYMYTAGLQFDLELIHACCNLS